MKTSSPSAKTELFVFADSDEPLEQTFWLTVSKKSDDFVVFLQHTPSSHSLRATLSDLLLVLQSAFFFAGFL